MKRWRYHCRRCRPSREMPCSRSDGRLGGDAALGGRRGFTRHALCAIADASFETREMVVSGAATAAGLQPNGQRDGGGAVRHWWRTTPKNTTTHIHTSMKKIIMSCARIFYRGQASSRLAGQHRDGAVLGGGRPTPNRADNLSSQRASAHRMQNIASLDCILPADIFYCVSYVPYVVVVCFGRGRKLSTPPILLVPSQIHSYYSLHTYFAKNSTIPDNLGVREYFNREVL